MTLLAAVGIDLTSQRTFVDPGSWAPPLLGGAVILALQSFLLLGVAAVRSSSPSRTTGVLVSVPVVGFFGQAAPLIAKSIDGDGNGTLQLVLGGIIAVTLIATDYRLRTDLEQSDGPESRADATV